MKTIGIRICVSLEQYSKLQLEQIRQKSANGKKTALGEIVKMYMIKGMNIPENNKPAGEQSTKTKDSPPDTATTVAIAAKQREIIAKENELKKWEASLRAREFVLFDKSKSLNEEAAELADQRKEICNEKEDLLNKKGENDALRINIKHYESILKDKNEQIADLQNKYKFLQNELHQVLISIEHNTNENTFLKYIFPVAAPILIIILALIIFHKTGKMPDVTPHVREILKTFNNLSPEEQEKVLNFINQIIKNQRNNNENTN